MAATDLCSSQEDCCGNDCCCKNQENCCKCKDDNCCGSKNETCDQSCNPASTNCCDPAHNDCQCGSVKCDPLCILEKTTNWNKPSNCQEDENMLQSDDVPILCGALTLKRKVFNKAQKYRSEMLLPRWVFDDPKDASRHSGGNFSSRDKRLLEDGEFDPASKLYPLSASPNQLSDFGTSVHTRVPVVPAVSASDDADPSCHTLPVPALTQLLAGL